MTIRLPLTMAVTQVVLVVIGRRTYAVPSNLVEQVLELKPEAFARARAAAEVTVQGQAVNLRALADLLDDAPAGPPADQSDQSHMPVIVLRSGGQRLAVHVDEIAGNREVVVKNTGPQLARVPGITGATVLGSGEVVLIIDPVRFAARGGLQAESRQEPAAPAARTTQKTVMVVDDSLTVRRVTQRLLLREGYQVLLAKDGVEALEQLQAVIPDVLLVDVEMPRMDGFDLTRNVRSDPRTQAIPIIMITSRSAAKHRDVALGLGVNAYFGKPFQEADLLRAISRMILPAAAAM